MRPLAITAVSLTLPFALLSECGSADPVGVFQNNATTVSAEYGSSFGGWDLAKREKHRQGHAVLRADGEASRTAR
jgi:hypothetical protein